MGLLNISYCLPDESIGNEITYLLSSVLPKPLFQIRISLPYPQILRPSSFQSLFTPFFIELPSALSLSLHPWVRYSPWQTPRPSSVQTLPHRDERSSALIRISALGGYTVPLHPINLLTMEESWKDGKD